jgi:hypothetical protein
MGIRPPVGILGLVLALNASAAMAADSDGKGKDVDSRRAMLATTMPRSVTAILDRSIELIPSTSLIALPEDSRIARILGKPRSKPDFVARTPPSIPPQPGS